MYAIRHKRHHALRWRHNGYDSVSNHQPHDCLLNRLFRRRSKKHQSSASLSFVWGIHRDRWIPRTKGQLRGKCVGNSPGPVNSPHKGPLTRKMFPFDDVIMDNLIIISDLDECASNPCINNGTCSDHVNHYTCSCAAPFNGTNCEIGTCGNVLFVRVYNFLIYKNDVCIVMAIEEIRS